MKLVLTSQTLPVPQNSFPHPPDTNRGVETHTSYQIDWISITLPYKTKDVWPDGLPTENTQTDPYNAYKNAVSYADGRVQLWNEDRQDMGIHLTLSGKTCGNLRASLDDIIKHAWKQGGKITRIDLAVNDYTGRIYPSKATKYLQNGNFRCRAREYPIRNDPVKAGYSQYCGKMSSETHVCIYDKSAEQGECGFHVRAEIRYKGSKAQKAAKTYLQCKNVGAMIKGFIDFPDWREWQEVMGAEILPVPADVKPSNRVAWLLGQCAAAMAKEIALNGGDIEIMEQFKTAVYAYLSDLRQGSEEVA